MADYRHGTQVVRQVDARPHMQQNRSTTPQAAQELIAGESQLTFKSAPSRADFALSQHAFPAYQGDDESYEQATAFLAAQFKSLAPPTKPLYVSCRARRSLIDSALISCLPRIDPFHLRDRYKPNVSPLHHRAVFTRADPSFRL